MCFIVNVSFHVHWQVKTGPFAEHSNQLYNISGVPVWAKVNQGLIKMYCAEASIKFLIFVCDYLSLYYRTIYRSSILEICDWNYFWINVCTVSVQTENTDCTVSVSPNLKFQIIKNIIHVETKNTTLLTHWLTDSWLK